MTLNQTGGSILSALEDRKPELASMAKLQLEYCRGSVFDNVGPGVLLVHSCNCQGVWGAGIAQEFRIRYNTAYKNYRSLCAERHDDDLVGKAMLILPEGDVRLQHYIGCLFVRKGYGAPRKKELDDGYIRKVLLATTNSMKHLLDGIKKSIDIGEFQPNTIREIRMPKINSGLFQIPWTLTEQILLDINVSATECPALAKIFVYE